MSKVTKAIAALMLSVAIVFAAGCTKPDDPYDPNNGGNGGGNNEGSNPTTEGIYLGIIGFNYNLYPKEISLLNASTKSSFTSFIDNLTMENLTGLYYADYTALKKLKSFGQPPKLTNVALVTFTDGLDNASLDDSERNPENYPTREAYLNAISSKIRTDKVHGLDINAYTIGLRGNDVQDVAAFQNNLKKLASNDNNMYEVTSMDEALQRFEEIAESLHSTNTTTSLSLLVPPGYDDGLVLRFTFDQVNLANNSSLFIECTYKRANEGRRLESISYHGFEQGASSLSSVEKLPNGFYKFVFQNLKKDNGSFINEIDKNRLKLFRQISTGWEPETEFDNNNQSSVIEEQSSALIMLVLDCTTSLGSQFSSLKTGAKRFVETLVSFNSGGYRVTVSAVPTSGGTVSGNGRYEQGQSCTVSATANNGYTFTNWTESSTVVSYDADYHFTVNGDRSLVANFSQNPSWPNGILPGYFSVSSTLQVQFSQGNLQYRASTGTWRFAERQFNIIGDNNRNISSTYSGWIDLFGWGTSGYNGKFPYMTSTINSNYGNGYNDIAGTNYDWGVYNKISNGGNTAGQWRTLTKTEWKYVFEYRNTSSGIRYAKAKVNNVNGIILLPDNWSISYYSLNNTDNEDASYSSNVITASQWNTMEQQGAVFLPAAGGRTETTVENVDYFGTYWTASACDYDGDVARIAQFGDDHWGFSTDYYGSDRSYGNSVRLVR